LVNRDMSRMVFILALFLLAPSDRLEAQVPPSQGAPKTYVEMTPGELAKQVPELKHLEPASSQDELPVLLKRVGATVAEFFDNFSNTTCIERTSSMVDTPLQTSALHYETTLNYLALIKPGPDKTLLREMRTNFQGKVVPPESSKAVVTIGFVSMTAHFHPDFQVDSRFRYAGRETVEKKDTHVIAFAQRPDVARHVSQAQIGNRKTTVFVQGVAWIDPASFQILRLRTDIQRPEIDIGVGSETTEIQYSEVTFQQGGKTLWLPRQVMVSGQLGRDIFRNHHRYADYRFFLVETNQKQQTP